MGWEVYPDGLRDLLIGFKASYANLPPIYITENGMASDDQVIDGRVDDASASRSSSATSRPSTRRSRRASTFAAISCGR